MPTKTAMHLITLAHSLLNLCGSPKWLSRQGYSRPTTAAKKHKISRNSVKCHGAFFFVTRVNTVVAPIFSFTFALSLHTRLQTIPIYQNMNIRPYRNNIVIP